MQGAEVRIVIGGASVMIPLRRLGLQVHALCCQRLGILSTLLAPAGTMQVFLCLQRMHLPRVPPVEHRGGGWRSEGV